MRIPAELEGYLATLHERVRATLGDDLLGVWLIGSAAQGAYEHGISDVDVLALSGHDRPAESRRALGAALVHPNLPCPTAGLEFVWYARPDLVDLGDPVRFQLNVNGGLDRPSVVQLEPEGPNWWSVLDLAAARHVGVPIGGDAEAAALLPRVPEGRLRRAVRESLDWHDGPDAGSPNRVLNLARLLILLEGGRWVSKPAGAAELRVSHPDLAPALDEALRARAEKRWVDPALASALSTAVRRALGAAG